MHLMHCWLVSTTTANATGSLSYHKYLLIVVSVNLKSPMFWNPGAGSWQVAGDAFFTPRLSSHNWVTTFSTSAQHGVGKNEPCALELPIFSTSNCNRFETMNTNQSTTLHFLALQRRARHTSWTEFNRLPERWMKVITQAAKTNHTS